MGRVVAGADGVQIVPLHEQHRVAHLVAVEDPALPRVEVVPVHPPDPEPPPVHQPGVTDDLHPAEARPQGDGLGGVRHVDRVQARHVRAPALHRADLEGVRRGGVRDLGGEPEFGAGDPHRVSLGRAAELECQAAPSGVGIAIRAEEHVVQGGVRPVQEGHLAEEAREPPLVLVLDVGHRRPLVDPDDQDVLPLPDAVRHVQFLPQATPPDDPHLVTVQPHPPHGLQPVEPQPHPAGGEPFRWELEPPAVVAGRIGVRNVRGVERKRVLDVGVRRTPPAPVPAEDPVGGDVDRVPSRVVVVGAGRRGVRLADAGVEAEPPLAAQVESGGTRVQVGARGDPASGPGGDRLDVAGVGVVGHASSLCPRQPLVAPRVSPATKCFCRTK